MSIRDNLEKAKRYVAGANFLSAFIMLLTYFYLHIRFPEVESIWLLVAGLIFAFAGLIFIWFVKRLQTRLDKANIH